MPFMPLRKRLSKLFLGETVVENGFENAYREPAKSSSEALSGEQDLSSKPSAIPNQSPNRYHAETRSSIPSLFSSLSDRLRWSATLLHARNDENEGPQPAPHTPRRYESLSKLTSATWSRSGGKFGSGEKRRRAFSSEGGKASPHTPTRAIEKSLLSGSTDETPPSLNVRIPNSSLVEEFEPGERDSTKLQTKTDPHSQVKQLWPSPKRVTFDESAIEAGPHPPESNATSEDPLEKPNELASDFFLTAQVEISLKVSRPCYRADHQCQRSDQPGETGDSTKVSRYSFFPLDSMLTIYA